MKITKIPHLLPFLTLDKSYLRACQKIDIAERSNAYRLVLPEAQAYEVIKDDCLKRAELFRKFPENSLPYTVAVSIQKALRFEADNLRPYSQEHAEPRDISIHKSLANPKYSLSAYHRSVLERLLLDIKNDMVQILFLAKNWQNEHTAAFSGSDSERRTKINQLEQFICSADFVNEACRFTSPQWETRIDRGVPSTVLTKDWVTFRWFQVNALFALDIANRYPNLSVAENSHRGIKQLNHDVLDSRGLLTALFVGGGFATQEKKLMRFWKLLNPTGELVFRTRDLGSN